jgi:HlyD family secretion protein
MLGFSKVTLYPSILFLLKISLPIKSMPENPTNYSPTDIANRLAPARASEASANGSANNEPQSGSINSTTGSEISLKTGAPLPTGDISSIDDPSKALTGELITTLGHDLAPGVDRNLSPISLPNMELQDEAWYQKKWLWAVAAIGLLAIPATPYIAGQVSASNKAKIPVVVAPPPKVNAVTALGRLEPAGEVTKLTASSSQTALVREILVKEGDKVAPNQILAVLDSVSVKKAQLLKANEDIRVAKTNLEKVKAGAKLGERNAQSAEVLRLQQELRGEINTSKETLNRLKQQLLWDGTAQGDRVGELQKQLAGELATSESEGRRLVLVAQNAQAEYQRYQKLYDAGGTTAILLDNKRLARDTAIQEIEKAKSRRSQVVAVLEKQISGNSATKNRINGTLAQQIKEAEATYNKNVATLNEQIKQAKANVDRIAEVRPVDLRSAEAEITRAEASARQAQADLELAYVRSPIAGEVFKIQTKPGEAPSSKGILEIAQNDQMVAVAEVYESDIGKVKVGQTAEINSETGSFTGKIQGTVVQVGLQVAKKDVLNTDPAADADSRVVEVKIAIDPAQSNSIRALTNSKVEIKIKTE